jgi:nicotinate dehydrogenase subunit B
VPGNPAEGPELLLALVDEGDGRLTATALAGHVDLGTGIRTAYGQIVAEELGLPLDAVQVMLGDTGRAPNQGPTIASASLQIHAEPLRLAAAQARAWLVAERGSAGVRHRCRPAGRASHVELMLDPGTPTKPPADYTVVGQRTAGGPAGQGHRRARSMCTTCACPACCTAAWCARPYAGWTRATSSATAWKRWTKARSPTCPASWPGGAGRLHRHGRRARGPGRGRDARAAGALGSRSPRSPRSMTWPRRSAPTRRHAARGGRNWVMSMPPWPAATGLARTYVWPYQLHASIGPSCAVADWQGDRATVWAGTQNPHVLRADLALLTGLPDVAIDVVRLEAAGCYGRNGADDVAADALLLSRAVGRPVRVQLTREQEHAWEPKGAAQLMTVRGGLGRRHADGLRLRHQLPEQRRAHAGPAADRHVCRRCAGLRDGRPHRRCRPTPMPTCASPCTTWRPSCAPAGCAACRRCPTALRTRVTSTSWPRRPASTRWPTGCSTCPTPRAAELLRATADKAGWVPHTQPQPAPQAPDGDWLRGQGVAYARYVHSKFPGFGAAWAAWVADVEVHQVTGEVHVSRVVVGHDAA